MTTGYTQLQPDSSGNKLREQVRTIGANDVRHQAVFQCAPPTYFVLADSVAFANNKQHISIFNGSGSGVMLGIKKLFMVNMTLDSAISGVRIRMNVRRISTCSDGNDLTPLKHDSGSADLPAQVLLKTNATVTEGGLLYPLTICNDEALLTQGSSIDPLLAGLNWMPEGWEIQELRLREGEGFTVRQVTAAAVGAFSWLVVFTVDDLN